MKWTQVDTVLEGLAALGGQAPLADLYRQLPDVPEHSIRRTLEQNSKHSKAYTGRRGDLFYPVRGIGYGEWGIVDFEAKTPEEEEAAAGRKTITSIVAIRNSRIILSAKAFQDHQCQLCKDAPKRPDGHGITEGHHIQPLGTDHKGPDVIENILVLCPNCHALCDQFAIPLPESLANSSGAEYQTGLKYIQYHNEQYKKAWPEAQQA